MSLAAWTEAWACRSSSSTRWRGPWGRWRWWIGRIAGLQVGDRGGEPAGELVGDGAVDDEAGVLGAVDRDGPGEGLP
jgi:hypothetical protein